MKFAIVYYSKTGHTREMAEVIVRGLAAAGGETRFFSVEEAMDADYIDQCAGVIFGTPTYLANTCWQMKQWFDEGSRGIKLAGKLGGVFATAHYAQGGADVAIMTLLPHMLVKGMLVYSGGAAHGKPYIHIWVLWLWMPWATIMRNARPISRSSAAVSRKRPGNCSPINNSAAGAKRHRRRKSPELRPLSRSLRHI